MNWEVVNLDALIQSALVGSVTFYLVMRIGMWILDRPTHKRIW